MSAAAGNTIDEMTYSVRMWLLSGCMEARRSVVVETAALAFVFASAAVVVEIAPVVEVAAVILGEGIPIPILLMM